VSVDVETLLVADEVMLRDGARLKRVYRGSVLTHRLVSGAGGLVCAVCAWSSGYFAWGALTDGSPVAPALWVAALASAVMTAFMAVFSRAFWVEAGLSPLAGYFDDPGAFDFIDAEVVSASRRRAERGSGDYLLKVRYEGGSCFASVPARSWNRHFNTGAKDRRRRLPVKGWVLCRRGEKTAELVGLSAS
jgi:hypothetical protein